MIIENENKVHPSQKGDSSTGASKAIQRQKKKRQTTSARNSLVFLTQTFSQKPNKSHAPSRARQEAFLGSAAVSKDGLRGTLLTTSDLVTVPAGFWAVSMREQVRTDTPQGQEEPFGHGWLMLLLTLMETCEQRRDTRLLLPFGDGGRHSGDAKPLQSVAGLI